MGACAAGSTGTPHSNCRLYHPAEGTPLNLLGCLTSHSLLDVLWQRLAIGHHAKASPVCCCCCGGNCGCCGSRNCDYCPCPFLSYCPVVCLGLPSILFFILGPTGSLGSLPCLGLGLRLEAFGCLCSLRDVPARRQAWKKHQQNVWSGERTVSGLWDDSGGRECPQREGGISWPLHRVAAVACPNGEKQLTTVAVVVIVVAAMVVVVVAA